MSDTKAFWKNPEFIVAQACMIVATVAGVYLASSQGLKAAIEFQVVESDRTSYYQQTALAHELRTNTEELEEYIELWQKPNTIVVEGYLPSFDTFIWEASTESEGTFEISPPILLGMVEFHREVNGAIEARLGKKISREDMMNTLIAQRDKARNETLPGLERTRDAFREKLGRYNIDVE